MRTELRCRIDRLRRFLTREMITVLGVTCASFLATGLLAPVLPLYLDSMGVEADLLGLMFSVSSIAAAASELTSGWLVDRIGVKVMIFIVTLLYGASISGFLLVKTVPSIFLIFILYGLFQGPVFIIGRWHMAINSPQNAKVFTIALLMAVLSGSNSLGSLSSGLIAATWGNQASVLVAIVPPVFVGLILAFSIQSLRFRVATTDGNLEASHTRRTSPTSRSILKPLIVVGGVAAFQITCYGILRTFLPLFATESIGVDVEDVGILFGIQGMMQILAAIPLGRLADKKGKNTFIIMGMVGIIFTMFGIANAKSFYWLLGFVASFSISFTVFSNTITVYLSEQIPNDKQGIAMGVYGAMEGAGLIAGPAFAGWLWTSYGPRSAFLLGSGFSCLGLLSFLLLGAGLKLGQERRGVD